MISIVFIGFSFWYQEGGEHYRLFDIPEDWDLRKQQSIASIYAVFSWGLLILCGMQTVEILRRLTKTALSAHMTLFPFIEKIKIIPLRMVVGLLTVLILPALFFLPVFILAYVTPNVLSDFLGYLVNKE